MTSRKIVGFCLILVLFNLSGNQLTWRVQGQSITNQFDRDKPGVPAPDTAVTFVNVGNTKLHYVDTRS